MDIEFGICDICKEEKALQRVYFHYNIQCECHSPNHFQIVHHCNTCTAVRPEITKLTIKTNNLTTKEV